ncbi:MAG: DNA repair protein RecN [SAR202 cluster bacterium]|nr:DNA repair protein RecN [SAR202 cluster bacterium]
MLRMLSVTNLALIEHLEIRFAPDLNVFTGETGAGKSIIVDALKLLFGARADMSLLRSGTDNLRVEGIYYLNQMQDDELVDALRQHGIETSDDELVIGRDITRAGRNTCRVNGRIVPLSFLNTISSYLVDISGQGQQFSLLRTTEHIKILDKYAGLVQEQKEFANLVEELYAVRVSVAELNLDDRDVAHQLDLLNYQIKEINDAAWENGEEQELIGERNVLVQSGKLRGLADNSYRLLMGENDQDGALGSLGELVSIVKEIQEIDVTFAQSQMELENIYGQAEELALYFRRYRDEIQEDTARLNEIENRLTLIGGLKKKYGNSVEEVADFLRAAVTKLDGLVSNDETLSELREKQQGLLRQVGAQGLNLSKKRRQAIADMAFAVEEVLEKLAMEGTRFDVQIQHKDDDDGVVVDIDGKQNRFAFDRTGIDRIEFQVSSNVGEPLRPLAKIASGGESARLLLALKSVLSQVDGIPTLIFDEIDSGIGGQVGVTVGSNLWELSKNHQVLCVTHLPQIAAFADRHVRVTKSEVDTRTVTLVDEIDGDMRVQELNKMLGLMGVRSSENAELMLQNTNQWKDKRRD